ncbi:relaxase, partial [Salmonella enterica]|nr:relaxase [Salmonella enterica]
MLARINGGNSGIREYLENGLKQGREFGRDDLDNRIILDGNIDHLENTINSIEDKGQERYMHITLSFAENEISKKTLQAVTEEYKNLLMNAYHTDEYCFYAEAHLPKIKNITDEKTGEVIERKPHIHIVIPRTNLVTQKSLNPRGDVTKSNSIKLMDSIQEHINNKYNLISPKDSIRVSDNNHANVLSRYKGDFFKGRETTIKKEIFNDLDSKNIRTEKDFLNNLARYGEVKTYNKGKENQYHAVKLPDNDKFTRLKSPLFSEQYITKRELPLVKPTPKEIEKNLTQWLEKTSHEIKHIYPSSQKNRDVYKALSDDQKAQVLNQIKDKYNDRYNLTDDRNQERDRTLSARGLIERGFKVSREQPNARLTPERLPSLQERHMVYELQGFRGQQTKQSDTVLFASNSRDMAEVRQTRQHDSSSMRWAQDNTRGINSNLKQEQKEITHKPDNNDLQVMKEIRTKINPDRFLSFCADKYKINPNDHVVTFAKDGSPRFNAGKTNLNASDFLTKHLKIDWKEAKENLIEVYNGQLNNTKFNKNTNLSKTDERSANRTDNLIKKIHYQELKQINREYQRDLFKINRIKDTDKREVERGFAMFNYLKASEKLNTITAAKQIVANEIRATTPKEDRNMAEIYNADRDVSFTKSMEKKKVLQQYQSDIDKGVKLTDLVCSKKEKEITYTDKKTQKEVFTDKGSHLHVPDTQGKEKIALALEYAEKKFGGKLQLSGSEQFKMTAAITAAEKGMNIILTPDKYHQMMLDHVEKMKQPAQQEQATISKGMTAEQKAPEQADVQAKPDTEKLKVAVEQTPDP